jgi:hypothetical protein
LDHYWVCCVHAHVTVQKTCRLDVKIPEQAGERLGAMEDWFVSQRCCLLHCLHCAPQVLVQLVMS